MKILPLSDIHGNLEIFDHVLNNFDVNDYDILTVSGDIWEGRSTKLAFKWKAFQNTINKPIIMIQGNHDWWDGGVFDGISDIHLLHNDGIEIDGVSFFGTPNTVNFGNWKWMKSEIELLDLWNDAIPENLDVLLSHGPPHSKCDNCNQPVYHNNANSMLGSKSLYSVIMDKAPKYVFCGHIHTGDRFKIMPNGSKIYNVSCLDEQYKFMGYNPSPKVIELKLD